MEPEDIADGVRAFFASSQVSLLGELLVEVDRTRLLPDRTAIVDNDEARRARDDTLRRLQAREVFPAGALLLTGPDGGPDTRQAEVAVTDAELVVLAADPRHAGEELLRIPRAEVTGVRLLDEQGAQVWLLPTEVEELDLRDRRYIVWVDHEVAGATGGHAFAFLAYTVAAEAERDFRRHLPPGAKSPVATP